MGKEIQSARYTVEVGGTIYLNLIRSMVRVRLISFRKSFIPFDCSRCLHCNDKSLAKTRAKFCRGVTHILILYFSFYRSLRVLFFRFTLCSACSARYTFASFQTR